MSVEQFKAHISCVLCVRVRTFCTARGCAYPLRHHFNNMRVILRGKCDVATQQSLFRRRPRLFRARLQLHWTQPRHSLICVSALSSPQVLGGRQPSQQYFVFRRRWPVIRTTTRRPGAAVSRIGHHAHQFHVTEQRQLFLLHSAASRGRPPSAGRKSVGQVQVIPAVHVVHRPLATDTDVVFGVRR